MGLKIQPQLLKQRQAMSLYLKIGFSRKRIREWYEQWNGSVFVAFSGGKDSTVLLHLVRSMYPEVPAFFADTGLEYPEIRHFVAETSNVTILKPKINFKQVLDHHGYPIISKSVACTLRKLQSPNISRRYENKLMYGDERGKFGMLPKKYRYLIKAPFKISDRCCEVMKKRPVHAYIMETGRKQIIGTMAVDSNWRTREYLTYGCALTHIKEPRTSPLSFWLERDIWAYIKKFSLPYCSIYDTGVRRTGCVFCCFGVHLEDKPNRFQLLKKTHLKLYKYCMEQLGINKVLDFVGVDYK